MKALEWSGVLRAQGKLTSLFYSRKEWALARTDWSQREINFDQSTLMGHET